VSGLANRWFAFWRWPRWPGWVWGIVLTIGLPVLYLLSFFPLGVLKWHGIVVRGTFPNSVIYWYAAPIRLVSANSPKPVGDFLQWHWDMCWSQTWRQWSDTGPPVPPFDGSFEHDSVEDNAIPAAGTENL
jgi:hypothetical protein